MKILDGNVVYQETYLEGLASDLGQRVDVVSRLRLAAYTLQGLFVDDVKQALMLD